MKKRVTLQKSSVLKDVRNSTEERKKERKRINQIGNEERKRRKERNSNAFSTSFMSTACTRTVHSDWLRAVTEANESESAADGFRWRINAVLKSYVKLFFSAFLLFEPVKKV